MTKQLEAGKTYISENGIEWFCISVYDDCARMHDAMDKYGPAHVWSLDGTPIRKSNECRIVFEPERGELVLYGSLDNVFSLFTEAHQTNRLTIPTLDGEIPEGEVTIKVEKL